MLEAIVKYGANVDERRESRDAAFKLRENIGEDKLTESQFRHELCSFVSSLGLSELTRYYVISPNRNTNLTSPCR
jgi:hypothetical protein